MTLPRIAPIVEGHGEVEAVPILLRRIAEAVRPAVPVDVLSPIRIDRSKIVKPPELERAVDFAARRAGADGRILILLDADDDCPAHFATELLQRARAARTDRAVRVVLAKTEYEAWFLAAAGSIAGQHDIAADVVAPPDPEAVRGAKEWLARRMPPGRKYRPTLHQAALTKRFDMEAARSASSFDKLWRDVTALLLPGAPA